MDPIATLIPGTSVFLRWYQRVCGRAGRTLGTWRLFPYLSSTRVSVVFFDGRPFTIDLKDPGGIQVLLHGFEEESEHEQVARRLTEHAISLDVGANFGIWTRWLAFKCPLGVVHSIEPAADTFKLLESNAQGFPNIRLNQMCCGSASGTAYLSTETNSGLRHISRQGERVRMIAIDDLRLPLLDFIKIDVEGMELEVLRGAAETIKRTHPLILFEFASSLADRYGYSYEDIERFLSGYSISRVPETNNYLATQGKSLSHG